MIYHMANTTSWQWSNGKIFDIARNKVAVMEDNTSVVSRTRLLILSEPTSMYNDPDFGVGLARHLWHYNNANEKAIIKDRIKEQLRINEPYSIPDQTQFADGLLFTGGTEPDFSAQEYNRLKMTVAVKTTYNDTAEVVIENE